MELVGRPPVPPRAAFGLWVSEYGYDDWAELEGKLKTLREHRFPVDGFVLDLQWFGGIERDSESSRMGRLAFDTPRFPDPAGKVRMLREEQGLGLIPIEESCVSRGLAEHGQLHARGGMVRAEEGGLPVLLRGPTWWGKGGMIDWSNSQAADWWHDLKRQPLVEMGIAGHWIDLGEPERYEPTAWYHGDRSGHRHADVHNLYNLFWAESVARGYARHGAARRPFLLSRSGVARIWRYGAAMWSGDIGSSFGHLAAQQNAQMHMSASGVDYFGSDVGGFDRAALGSEDMDDLYTRWFADASLLDVPLRPHVANACNCYESAPDRIGDRASNLANLRTRYALGPYLYSLAHRAWRTGDPVFAPAAFWFQAEHALRSKGDEKMIGRDLLVAVTVKPGERVRDVYLPPGDWYDFESGALHRSRGEWVREVPVVRDGLLRAPMFARAGSIVPRMHVDEQTMNMAGRRLDRTRRDELVVRVYPGPDGRFTLYEDDGETIAYQRGEVRETELAAKQVSGRLEVTVSAARGDFAGAPAERDILLEAALRPGETPSRVTLGGEELPRFSGRTELERRPRGWCLEGAFLLVRSGIRPVAEPKRFAVTCPSR